MSAGGIYFQIATLMGLGRSRIAPGTFGSAVGAIFCLTLHRFFCVYVIFFVLSFIVGIIAANHVEKLSGENDPGYIIIDEFSCIFVVFLFIPQKAMTYPVLLAGFILYRVLDIVKIPPLNYLEKIKGGFGVMLDDLGSGIISGALLNVLLSIGCFPLSR